MTITGTVNKIKSIRAAQKATETVMGQVIDYLKSVEEPTSEEAHVLIDQLFESQGFESPEGHIVAAGIPSHEPHERGSDRIEKGVPIVIDIFPRSKTTGYYADMTRTVCIGSAPKELQAMYDAVKTAQEIAFPKLRAGAKCQDVHRAVRDFFDQAGYKTSGQGTEFKYAEGFVHSLGHGVGQEIHESPRLSENSTDILKVGDVITIEPGLYYKHIGGIRLEDMVLITEEGFEIITSFERKLEI
jgi:Xaa-Pro aminopeptidase